MSRSVCFWFQSTLPTYVHGHTKCIVIVRIVSRENSTTRQLNPVPSFMSHCRAILTLYTKGITMI